MRLKKTYLSTILMMLLFTWAGCSSQDRPPVASASVEPGGTVKLGSEEFALLGVPIAVGKTLPSATLVDAMSMREVDLSQERGKVLLLSLVPSLDTRVCEVQTHFLGEEGDKLAEKVERITISRDTPFAQKRFAEEADLTDIRYLSDYKIGEFGRSLGLLIEGSLLLARSVKKRSVRPWTWLEKAHRAYCR